MVFRMIESLKYQGLIWFGDIFARHQLILSGLYR